MKILLAHNFYRTSAPSGEDAVYRQERALLEANGHEVAVFERFNDAIDDSTITNRLKIAINTIWSVGSRCQFELLLTSFQPDVVHFHNIFPQISASPYSVCRNKSIPVIQTLHNYRLLCANAMLLRDGKPCESCVGKLPYSALRFRCYRGSLLATSTIVGMQLRNYLTSTLTKGVCRYIALTKFAAKKFAEGGLPAERICIRPNFLVNPPPPGKGGGPCVFVGRLSEEKGIFTLLKAWRELHDIPLRIIGDGHLRGEIEHYIKANYLNVELLGHCDKATVLSILRDASVLIQPSECYEGFPMAIIEAYASGTPVLASRIGSLDEIVEENITGSKFTPGNHEELVKAVKRMMHQPEILQTMRYNVRQKFDRCYNADVAYLRLIKIYEEAIKEYSL